MDRPKTNAYPKHYDISDYSIILGAIGPKSWHPVFASQVDTIIPITCDKIIYRFEAIADCLPSQFPHPRVLRRT